MATEKILIFDEQGNAKRMKVRIARFLDNEPVTAADKTNIRTTLDVDDSLSGTFTTPLSVTSASDSSFTGGGKVGIGTSSPGSYYSASDDLVVAGTGNRGVSIIAGATSSSSIAFGSGTGTDAYRGKITYDNNAHSLSFNTLSATRWTINSTGNLVANGTAIDFGSGATLSDYEEGTHTATLTPQTSGTITLSGTRDELGYTRVGNLVTVYGYLVVTSVSSPVGDYINLSLPYQIATLADNAGAFSGSLLIFNAAGNSGDYTIGAAQGESVARIYKNTGTSAVATAADFSGNETIRVNFSYQAV